MFEINKKNLSYLALLVIVVVLLAGSYIWYYKPYYLKPITSQNLIKREGFIPISTPTPYKTISILKITIDKATLDKALNPNIITTSGNPFSYQFSIDNGLITPDGFVLKISSDKQLKIDKLRKLYIENGYSLIPVKKSGETVKDTDYYINHVLQGIMTAQMTIQTVMEFYNLYKQGKNGIRGAITKAVGLAGGGNIATSVNAVIDQAGAVKSQAENAYNEINPPKPDPNRKVTVSEVKEKSIIPAEDLEKIPYLLKVSNMPKGPGNTLGGANKEGGSRLNSRLVNNSRNIEINHLNNVTRTPLTAFDGIESLSRSIGCL